MNLAAYSHPTTRFSSKCEKHRRNAEDVRVSDRVTLSHSRASDLPEDRRGERSEDPWIDIGVVLGAAVPIEIEAVVCAHAGSQHNGDPFGVHDILHHGPHDGARLLEDEFVRGVGATVLQLGGEDVVVAHEDGVQEGERRVLVHAVVP